MKKPTRADAIVPISEINAWLGGFREAGNQLPAYLLRQHQDQREQDRAAVTSADGGGAAS